MDQSLLEQVFLSHSSVDKPFVRKLTRRIEKEGFRVWLDEKKLVAGDALGKTISEALDRASVVLIVVSKASVKSRWLSFELNKATERMVKGQCRVIPVVVEKIDLPAEVKGLMFADFTSSFKFGFKAVLTALQHEARRKLSDSSFSRRADSAVTEVFGHISFGSTMGEYESIRFEEVQLPIPSQDSKETRVKYDSVLNRKPLSDRWWMEYEEAFQRVGDQLGLVVTEQPVGFTVEVHSNDPRIAVKSLVLVDGYVVFVDLSELSFDQFARHLVEARKLLMQFASQRRGRR
jgi:TIR domain